MESRKKIAARLAEEASIRTQRDLEIAFGNFVILPSASYYVLLQEACHAYQQAHNTERAIAGWED